ncbi:MAG TPA: hypothetical protein VGX24_15790 [Pyrinomonadaceae bacterium]|jgi:hypothetical protein|nr:hypothetical protein [Pyrinomonadaceae bacterium]
MRLLKLLHSSLNLRAHAFLLLRPLVIAVALVAASAGASGAHHEQHGGHEGHTAPKQAAPKRKAAPRRKTAPRKRTQRAPARKPSTAKTAPHATADPHAGHDMHGGHNMAQPAPAVSPESPATPATPATLPSNTATEAAPDAPPPPAHVHPTATPQENPAPASQQSEPVAPVAPATPAIPATPATPAEIDHSMHAPAPAKAPHAPATVAPATDKAAPAATAVDHSMHTGHVAASKDGEAGGVKEVSEAEVNELMVMSGETMGIRNGTSRANFTPMGQMGSGTSWQPATTPMHMTHKFYGDWLFMFHGEAKLGVNAQGGLRGVTKFESQNWIMPMAYRRVGAGTLQLRAMLSLEPLTFSGAGSPQLFQTGEVYKGEPIIDAQHPHDLFMELSAQYTVPVGERATWFTYFGFPGEPALGPVAFMHRASASENPTAPLTHHLQDSTHISFGVLTTGFTYRWFKLEGSIFNGREPDERRYNFERGAFNSRSARLSFAPNANWAFQLSHGFLRNPEQSHEGDLRRTTASVQYNRAFRRGNLAAALVWGRNHEYHDGETFNLNGYTFETTANFLDKNYLYTRLELVDKSELLRHSELDALGFDHDTHPQFRIGAYTFGYVRDVWNTDRISVGVGGDFTFYSKPAILDSVYGNSPKSYKFFLRFRPGRMKMDGHADHDNATGNKGAHDAHDKH